MKKVDIYTDGACSGNPGKGGWAAILIYKGHEKVISGGEIETTNNRMELSGIIYGISALKESCDVILYSDSAYCTEPFIKGWIESWQSNGWKTLGKESVKNVDLWQKLLEVIKKHKVTFIRVKGHSDNAFNNRCDEIARAEIKKLN